MKKHPQIPVHGPRSAAATDLIKTDSFEVARLDYSQNRLQRIFVVIRPDKAADTTFIRQIIRTLRNHYPADGHTNVSFFSRKKFANYEDELFEVEGHSLPETEYENWLNLYYLGEFELETALYAIFPLTNNPERRKVFSLPSISGS